MDINYDVIIIGGGASGMMAGVIAARADKKVLIIEKNKYAGEKLKISGGGRCNILNYELNTKLLLKNYVQAEKYLHTPFSKFGVAETVSFFKDIGIDLKIEDRKRAFPKSEKAIDVYNALYNELVKNKVELKTESIVEEILFQSLRFIAGVKIKNDKNIYKAEKYILATGGYSHPETGSTGDGFKFLKNIDLPIQISEPVPSLVPIAVSNQWVKNLTGNTIENIKVSFFVDGVKKKMIRFDRILFTHFGLSGPTILNNSKYISELLTEGEVILEIDLFPSRDEGELNNYLLKIFDENKNKTFKNILNQIYPGNILEEVFIGSPPFEGGVRGGYLLEKKVNDIRVEERKNIIKILKNLKINIIGLMGFDKAIIASGGVNIDEVNFENMSLKKVSNLFVTGDMLDINRPSGGFSLQLCWTTGFIAGSA